MLSSGKRCSQARRSPSTIASGLPGVVSQPVITFGLRGGEGQHEELNPWKTVGVVHLDQILATSGIDADSADGQLIAVQELSKIVERGNPPT